MPDENLESKIKTVTQDGETVTFFEPSEIVEKEKWDRKKAAASGNAFAKCGLARISTQGPER